MLAGGCKNRVRMRGLASASDGGAQPICACAAGVPLAPVTLPHHHVIAAGAVPPPLLLAPKVPVHHDQHTHWPNQPLLLIDLRDTRQQVSDGALQDQTQTLLATGFTMSRIEYVNISGLRVDGRRPREVRRLQAEMGVFHKTDGSAIFEMGNTKVLAVVHGPREATRRGEHDEAIINCEYSCVASTGAAAAPSHWPHAPRPPAAVPELHFSPAWPTKPCSIAPFATSERRKRRGGDRRITEAAAALKQCFATVIESKLYARSQIDIHIQVLQSDGGAMAGACGAASQQPQAHPPPELWGLPHRQQRFPVTCRMLALRSIVVARCMLCSRRERGHAGTDRCGHCHERLRRGVQRRVRLADAAAR